MSSDLELLARFAANDDQAAFEEIVRRHDALVFGVCRRTLGSAQDAEDAAQMVFATLALKAGSLRSTRSLPGWLHRTALHVSTRKKISRERRRRRECQALQVGAAVHSPAAGEQIAPHLDREIDSLPERYRVPFVLHHIQGKSQMEAARMLGWSYGTLSARLHRARAVLRQRLARRGLFSFAATLACLAQSARAATSSGVTSGAAPGRATCAERPLRTELRVPGAQASSVRSTLGSSFAAFALSPELHLMLMLSFLVFLWR